MNPTQLAQLLRFVADAIDAYQPPVSYTDLNELRKDAGLEPKSSPAPKPQAPKVKLSDLQSIAKDLIVGGYRDQFVRFLESTGAKSLSALPAENYAAALEALLILKEDLDAQ